MATKTIFDKSIEEGLIITKEQLVVSLGANSLISSLPPPPPKKKKIKKERCYQFWPYFKTQGEKDNL